MPAKPKTLRLADLSLSTDDEDGVFLVLRAARQNPNLEEVESHIRTVRPDLNEICAELDYIEEVPDYDEEDTEARLRSIAQDVPPREDLLRMIG